MNLSAGKTVEEDRGGSLRVLGRELLQNPDKVQHQQEQVLSHSAAAAGQLSSHFGLPPHFLFPFTGMPGAPGSPSSESDQGFTPPTAQGGKSQIFNLEAYCKLCNKEFCNKYFLKTHMANKHGIYSEGVPGSSAAPTSLTMAPSMFDRGMRMPTMLNVSLPTTPVSYSGSFMAMASSLRPGSDLAPSPHRSLVQESGQGRGSPHSPKDVSPARMSPPSGPPPLISNEERGEGQEEGELRARDEAEPGGLEQQRRAEELAGLPPGLRLSMVPPINPFGPLPFFNMNPMSPMELMRKEEEKKEMMAGSPKSGPNPGSGGGAPGPASKGNMTPDRLRQMGVINADAFCEFCCKEFCNKYFLRVHKLKKHGVCSPELPPEKVQKILAQMAKEAGKTGQPMPPLTLGTPSLTRPPPTSSSLSDPPKSLVGGGLGSPLNLIRPPTLPNFLSLPPLDVGREDNHSSSSSEHNNRPDEREEGRPVNLQYSPRSSIIEPECELRIDESAVIRSPLPEDPRDMSRDSEDPELRKGENSDSAGPPGESAHKGKETSEGLANLQNMIMKLNSSKSKMAAPPSAASENSTVCRKCNKDMENKYFLHAHMMNEHGILSNAAAAAEEDEGYGQSPMSISLPQYPADLSKLAEMGGLKNSGLNIPCPIITRPDSHSPLSNGLPKLSEKPLDYPKSIFEQMQGLPRPSFLDQMKKDLGSKLDLSSPLKRPSLERDPNKKPASLSRSYCEICKKELCNKYFMKTHMMKMHGIVMDQSPANSGAINCEICKKEVSSKYFLKVHMANAHGLNEDGAPIPPHMRENNLMNMFPIGDYPPPPMGEFSRMLMQQGEKNMKEMERLKESQAGHVCSLCSNTFPDIVALQVHIIKSHGALPPGAGLEGILGKSREREGEEARREQEKELEKEADITDREEEQKSEEKEKDASMPFPFPMDFSKQAGALKSSPINDLLQRQMLGGGSQFPGMMNPLLLPGAGAPAPAVPQQFQGLFNMFLTEMLKKVQKDTPPQTPPISPSPPSVAEQPPHKEVESTAGTEEPSEQAAPEAALAPAPAPAPVPMEETTT